MRSFLAGNKQFYQVGRLIKICGLRDAWYEEVDDPERIVSLLKRERNGSHIFTFFQRPPNIEPQYNYYMENYPASLIKINSYDDWHNNTIGKKTRYSIRKAYKEGVDIRITEFNDDFVKGISEIYNETPIRAGKKFPHYKDSLEKVKRENETFKGRSIFVGAYYRNELIGFTKIVIEKEFADILQHLSKLSHKEKCASNALMAKAIEICASRKIGYLAYGDWDESGIGQFKKNNGFTEMVLPQYYIPLNWIGHLALRFNLHKPLHKLLPKRMVPFLKDIRHKILRLRLSE